MDKSPDAFRTISEVAESLETPAHVLRFWESRFPQIRPVKRAGGRRYYRPADVALLGGIRHLLHDEGMTIRGVQKILREQGVRHVAAMAAGGDAVEFDGDVLDGEELAPEEAVSATVVDLAQAPRPPVTAGEALGEVVRLRPVPPVRVVVDKDAPDPFEPRYAVRPEEVPEAGHVWVDEEPELELAAPANLFHDDPAPAAAPFMADAPEAAPKMAGMAARLRALPRPIAPDVLPDLMELHSRLGLLQAQMAEASRQRR